MLFLGPKVVHSSFGEAGQLRDHLKHRSPPWLAESVERADLWLSSDLLIEKSGDQETQSPGCLEGTLCSVSARRAIGRYCVVGPCSAFFFPQPLENSHGDRCLENHFFSPHGLV